MVCITARASVSHFGTLKITAVYDNSAENKANPDPTKLVKWGSQTVDEMMLGYIEYFTPMPDTKVAAAK